MDCIDIARKLIAVDSVTTHTNREIAELQGRLLEEMAFEIEWLPYIDVQGCEKICLAACRRGAASTSVGSAEPAGIAFLCHNDVVSVDGWRCPHGGPFDACVADGRLWGRGACDMKGPTASALAAVQQLDRATQRGPIYFFITGDEECGMHGARVLVKNSRTFGEMVDRKAVAVIGEPTEMRVVNQHKGGCHIDVASQGIAAHSSTNDGINANWRLIPFLSYLSDVARRCESDACLRNEDFSTPTLSLNMVIQNEPAAANITVGQALCRIFFRPMPNTAWESLAQEIAETARELQLEVSPIRSLQPLHTPADSNFVRTTLRLAQQDVPHSVCFATDGCCFESVKDLLVLGPGSIQQAHRADEWIDVKQLREGMRTYARLFQHYAYGE